MPEEATNPKRSSTRSQLVLLSHITRVTGMLSLSTMPQLGHRKLNRHRRHRRSSQPRDEDPKVAGRLIPITENIVCSYLAKFSGRKAKEYIADVRANTHFDYTSTQYRTTSAMLHPRALAYNNG
jgi:hypothetical protein